MKVISTNIGTPREIVWEGTVHQTGIYKKPIDAIRVRKYFIEGDTVSDLRVHGGEAKTVYGYPSEHYPFWRQEHPAMEFPWGTFGENLTTEGLFEREVLAGSVYRIGTAVLRVTRPRFPCFKLAVRFGTTVIIKQFMKSRKSGFYFTVVEEGLIRPGDAIHLEESGDPGCTILDMVNSHDPGE